MSDELADDKNLVSILGSFPPDGCYPECRVFCGMRDLLFTFPRPYRFSISRCANRISRRFAASFHRRFSSAVLTINGGTNFGFRVCSSIATNVTNADVVCFLSPVKISSDHTSTPISSEVWKTRFTWDLSNTISPKLTGFRKSI